VADFFGSLLLSELDGLLPGIVYPGVCPKVVVLIYYGMFASGLSSIQIITVYGMCLTSVSQVHRSSLAE